MNKEDYIQITPQDERWYIVEDLPNEYWKWIPFCVGYYKISNYSRVQGTQRNGTVGRNYIVKPSLKKDNYYQVSLTIRGKRYYKRVNRLMGETFLPNKNNYPIVDHLDNNKLNNFLYNLEWVNNLENTERYYSNYFVSTNKGRGKILPKKVQQYSLSGEVLETFDSITIAAMSVYYNKGKRGGISKSCRTNKPYKGFKWKYFEGGDVE